MEQALVNSDGTTIKGDGTPGDPLHATAASSTPGGATKDIQFNNAGAFGGDAFLTWDKTTGTLIVNTDVAVTPRPNATIDLAAGTNQGNVLSIAGDGVDNDVQLAATEIGATLEIQSNTSTSILDSASNPMIEVAGAATIGFFGATPVVKPTVTGSRGGNAALASLLTHLAALGLITDGTSA